MAVTVWRNNEEEKHGWIVILIMILEKLAYVSLCGGLCTKAFKDGRFKNVILNAKLTHCKFERQHNFFKHTNF